MQDEISRLEKVRFWIFTLLVSMALSAGAWLGSNFPKWLNETPVILDSIRVILDNIRYNVLFLFRANRTFAIIITVVLVVALGVGIWVCSPCLPKRKKKEIRVQNWTDPLMIVGVFLLAIILRQVATMFNKFTWLAQLVVGVFSLYIAYIAWQAAGDISDNRNSEDFDYFEKNKKTVLAKATGLGLALIGPPLWLPGYWGIDLTWSVPVKDLLEYYAALLSLTFISISVMSMLSDRSVVIYWDNIAEGKLIKPIFSSFAAYTYYSIGATIGAGISAVTGNGSAFAVFFLINMFTIIMLTINMVDVYYDREGKKANRVMELQEDLEDYLWLNDEQDDTEDLTDDEFRGKCIGARHYEQKMLLLCQHISRARDEHDMVYLEEVYKLFVENIRCFDTPDGRRVAQMLYTESTNETWPLVMHSIRDMLDQIEALQPKEEDPLCKGFDRSRYGWDQDAILWQCLARTELLPQWIREADQDFLDKQELKEFMHLMIRRLVALYNDMVAHSNYPDVVKPTKKVQKKAAVQIRFRSVKKQEEATVRSAAEYKRLETQLRGGCIHIRDEEDNMPDKVEIREVYKNSLGMEMTNSTLPERLLTVMTLMLQNMDDASCCALKVFLADMPLPGEMMKQEKMYAQGSPEDALWQKYFPRGEKVVS